MAKNKPSALLHPTIFQLHKKELHCKEDVVIHHGTESICSCLFLDFTKIRKVNTNQESKVLFKVKVLFSVFIILFGDVLMF